MGAVVSSIMLGTTMEHFPEGNMTNDPDSTKNNIAQVTEEFGVDRDTRPYLKWITNKELLYTAEKSAQCYITTEVGKESEEEYIHLYV